MAFKSDLNTDSWKRLSDTNPDVFDSRRYQYLKCAKAGVKEIFICREINTDLPGIMFVAQKSIASEKELPSTKGFEVRFDFLNSFKEDEVAVVIKISGDEYLDAFLYLIQDIFEKFDGKSDEKDIVDSFFNRINVWKTFFDKAKEKGMSDTYRRGLFCELLFLKNHLYPTFKEKAVKYWTGPNAGIHDFELGKLAIEVKSSAGNKSTKIKISNEKQLDEAGYNQLYLYQVSISVRKNATPTLIDMINEVGDLFKSDHNRYDEYKTLLLQYGYHPLHEDYYLGEGYHVDEENIYVVNYQFPRLIGSDLPEGIGALKYSVDLSACSNLKTDFEQLLSNFQQI